MKDFLQFKNRVLVDLIRDGKIIQTEDITNQVKTAGLNYLLDAGFRDQTPIADWYIGLMNNTPTPTELIGDTLASHTGWAELVPGTDFTGDRQAWTMSAAAAGVLASDTNKNFAMLTTKTVYGILVCSAATGTSGTLWCTAAFDNTMNVVSGDTVSVRYSITLS